MHARSLAGADKVPEVEAHPTKSDVASVVVASTSFMDKYN
jgi:hypothetical protein